MRFRRHDSRGFRWDALFGWVRFIPPWLGLPPLIKRIVAWIGPVGGKRRKRTVAAGALFAAFLLGYLIAATVLFPAPIFPRTQSVPNLIGTPLEEAVETLQDLGLGVSDTSYVSHPEIPREHVVWQDPPPQVDVPERAGVTIAVSRGPQGVLVPDVAGYVREIAIQLVEAAGLVPRIDTSSVAPVERGVVVTTNPTAGQSRLPGSDVILFVSVGAANVTVPDLSGLSVEEARELLAQSGLVLGSTRIRSQAGHEPGMIFDQSPAAGTLSAPGGAVNVTVARGGQT